MSKFESNIYKVPYSQERIYAKLSDLSNLESIRDKIPADKVSDLSFDSDTLSFSVSPIGKVSIAIIERDPCKCIKFEAKESPIAFYLWIQIVPLKDVSDSSKIKLTIQADMNPFIKAVAQKPLQEGLEKMAEMLSMIPY